MTTRLDSPPVINSYIHDNMTLTTHFRASSIVTLYA